MAIDAERIRFLYRTEQGRIDCATWLKGAGALAAVIAPFFLIWLALSPYTEHDLAKDPFFVPMTAVAYSFVLVYAFAILLVAVCYVNLSAKRFRDLGQPAPVALAGLAPLVALIDGATRWLQPRVAEVMPIYWVWGVDAVLVGVIAWSVYELGFREARSPELS
ncbi:hypothetical protein [Methylocystis iwaonis]|uniref:DUF805 domain-containing protein n=1 Tax=Methylocystis iwaonis TaxID=2885079 RepID=A0ABM8EBK7_9HYPH|nr:hypothetical protein [Methylocystis iwaonis]BDV35375.1 hypothetical protein SS37A_29040 [Methylocystis iwaonis]